jgi:hypothetical protein
MPCGLPTISTVLICHLLSALVCSAQAARSTAPPRDSNSPSKGASSTNSTSESAKRNEWQRMKDCADQTDRESRRLGWIDEKRTGTPIGWENHYSAKFNRCFILVHRMDEPSDRERALH